MLSNRLGILGVLAITAASASAQYSYTLVTEPNQGITPIYNFIGTAKKTIDMTMYEFTDTQGEQLLAQAAAAGVTVRVILDQNLEKSSNTAAYNYLSENGVQVHWANPTYAATHQKTITVDGATSAIMTLNLTSQYYSTSRDFAVIENDPNDVAAIEQTFNADFQNSAITPPDGDDLVWSPTNSQSAMLALINSALHALLVENEEMSDTAIVNALVSAASRGVLVQIAMTNDDNDYSSEFKQLVTAGAEIGTYAETASLYIHAKVILADYGSPDAQVFIGSENFSSASLTENRELGLIISNVAIMASIYSTLTSDFTGGTPWSGSKANFSTQANPDSLTVNAGSSGTTTVTTAVFDGFSSAVSLSASGLPSGVTASFSPSSIAAPGSGSSTLTLDVSGSATAGAHSFTITGSGGGVTSTAGASITIASGGSSFSLSDNPTAVTVAPGGSGQSIVTAAIAGGFSSAISLSASGLPTGVTAAFNPTSIAAPGSGSSTLTLSAASGTAAGNYTITITGSGGGLTETTSVSLTVTSSSSPAFSLAVSPASVTVAQGGAGTATATTTVSGGFDAMISLSASGLPAGATASFNPSSIAAPGAGTSTMTISVGSSTVVGVYTVTVTATGGGLSNTASVFLSVTSAAGGQLIVDGGFESATKSGNSAPGWTATTTVSGQDVIVYHGPYPHTGSNYASEGGYNSDTDKLTQSLTIPSTINSATLTFWVNVVTQETTTSTKYDYLYVEIHNSSGTLLATPLTLSNLDNKSSNNTNGVYFQPAAVSLASYKGQTIELVFHATTDYEKTTTFNIDDVSVTTQ